MKYTKLFEEFVNEGNTVPDDVMSLVKKIKLTDKFLNRGQNDYVEHVDRLYNGYRFNPTEVFTLLDNKLKNRTMPKHTDEINIDIAYRKYHINDYISINITNTNTSTTIAITDTLKYRNLKQVSLSGVAQSISDSLAKFFIENASLLVQLENVGNASGEMPLSIKKLYADADAMRIKKAITYGIEGNSATYAILLSALETSEPGERINDVKNAINILNQYLKDKGYINAAKFDNTK